MDGTLAARFDLRVRHHVERIRDKSVNRVGDQQSACDDTHEQADTFERLIGWLCQGIGSDSDVVT